MRALGTRERRSSTTSTSSAAVGPTYHFTVDPTHIEPGATRQVIGLGITSDGGSRRSSAAASARRARLRPHRYQDIRDWLRRARRRDSLRFPAIITGLATTLAVAVWLSLSDVRRPSPVWFSSGTRGWPFSTPAKVDELTRLAAIQKPRFALLIVPHPGHPAPIQLESIVNGLRRQTAHSQLHSLTLVCTPFSSCPQTPPRVQQLSNLNAFYPPPEAEAVLMLESAEVLQELDINWLANALALLFLPQPSSPLPFFISSSGLSRAHYHHLPTRLECVVGSKIISRAELALAPILLSAKPWSRLADLAEEDWLAHSGLPSLRLGLELFARQMPAFILPSPDASGVWKRCERGLGEMRQSIEGPALEAALVQHLDDSLFFENSHDDRMPEVSRDEKRKLCVMLDDMPALDGAGGGWGPIVCRFLERGFTVDVLVIVERLNVESEEKRRMSFPNCIVDVEILSGSGADGTRGRGSESKWIKLFANRQYSVIFFARDSMDPIVRDVLERRFKADFGQLSLDFAESWSTEGDGPMVVIGLPRESVKSADWITGLELQALRS
ncbi:hypothetical protein CROQUDRAFT_39597 [Cronartium quercuum f. sp. fusiforme G11]|uniref:Uncharacterized protein n=1 Tax=Cronartium quercuum f. sp. fusiforme G11 TaxID=708437 RepID=A0A9P6NST5_9BASI|nr:hypothetical protein CROQUDRAFT_39597 [Cronartium quercuum f. sp. fusiforme G11]